MKVAHAKIDIQAALNDGYSPTEIIDGLNKDGLLAAWDIGAARKAGHSDAEILNGLMPYLQSAKIVHPVQKAGDPILETASPVSHFDKKMAFNYDFAGAKKAGGTDEQIVSYLSKNHGDQFDFDGAHKAGVTDAQIVSYLAMKHGSEVAAQQTAQKSEKPISGKPNWGDLSDTDPTGKTPNWNDLSDTPVIQQVGTVTPPQPDSSHTVAWGAGVAVFVAVALLAWFKFKKTETATGVLALAQSPMSNLASEKIMTSNTKQPYEWSSVVVWTLSLFLLGLTTTHPPHGSDMDRLALRLFAGVIWAVVGGLIVAVIKHFKRSPKPDSNTALASAKANDKWIFYGSLVIAAFLIGKAIYLETYSALADAAILVGLGFGVKNGLGFARWLMAAYAFISAIIVVAFGSGSAVIWPFIFYAACRSIMDHRSVDVAREMDNKLIPSSARNTTSQQQSFSDSTKSAPIVSGQRTVQNAPAVAKPADTVRTPPTDAKPAMNNQPPVNAMPAIAIELSQQSIPEIEDRLYEQIAQEIETNTVDKGIWTKAFAQSGGDDKLTRVAYIKARFEKLMAAENARLEVLQREREEIAHREREKVERFELLCKRIKVSEQTRLADLKNLSISVEWFDFQNWCKWGFIDKVKEAVEKNPLLLAADNAISSGNTALHMAVIANQLEIAKFLAGKGASVSAFNNDGDTPIDIAKKSGQADLAAFLQQFSVV